jgi:hypothetical protein
MENHLEKVKKLHEENLKTSQQEGNETFRGLNIQLIFFAAAILSFSLLIFLNKDITSQLNINDKKLLILTWVLLGLSVLFGILQFWETYNFFKKHSDLQSFLVYKLSNDSEIKNIKDSLNIFSEEQESEMNKIYKGDIVGKLVYEKAKEMALEKFPKILPESSEIYIKIQTFLIVSSMGLLIFFMAKILL